MRFTAWPAWLMMVSMAMAVLPVLRSPMISSDPPVADGCHGVDGLDARLQGFAHGLAADDARGLHFHPACLRRLDGPLAVEGLRRRRADDVAQQGITDRHRLDPPRRLDDLLLLEVVDLAQDDGADRVLVEVQGQTERAVLDFEQLVDRGTRQSRHPAMPNPTSTM